MGKVMHLQRQGVDEKPLYVRLNFAMNLKQL